LFKPLISICIPSYNTANYITETINCFLSQSYQNIEIIIVDDGSTDKTLDILKKINSEKLKLIPVIKGGASKARNIAYQNSKGDYIIFFDADDFVQPTFVNDQVNEIFNKENIVVLSEWGRFYNDDLTTFNEEKSVENEYTLETWITTYWYNCNPMTNPGRAIIPKSVIEKAGIWNEELTLNDDLDFFTRIFLNVDKILINKNSYLYYRSGVNGLSGVKSKKAYQSLFSSLLLSTKMVSSLSAKSFKVKQSCANMWQSFIYEVYPNHKSLLDNAQKEIKNLCKPSIKYNSGKITKSLVTFFGWKLVKKLKLKLQR